MKALIVSFLLLLGLCSPAGGTTQPTINLTCKRAVVKVDGHYFVKVATTTRTVLSEYIVGKAQFIVTFPRYDQPVARGAGVAIVDPEGHPVALRSVLCP